MGVKTPSLNDRVAYSAGHLNRTCRHAHFVAGPERGGLLIGEAAFRRGLISGFSPAWDKLALVRWDNQSEFAPCQVINVGNLVCVEDISRDADSFCNSPNST